MDIDSIKKCIKKSPDYIYLFNTEEHLVFLSDGQVIKLDDLKDSGVFFRDLLQSAIEGINREYVKQDNGWAILQSEKAIVVYICYHQEKVFDYRDYDNETEAKAAALQWIFDQEIKNG